MGEDKETVKLRFKNDLVGTVIDRFGRDVAVTASDPAHFTVSVEVAVSPQFFAWLFGFGTGVEILAPEGVRSQFKQLAADVAASYER